MTTTGATIGLARLPRSVRELLDEQATTLGAAADECGWEQIGRG
jgi:hypothetical protein